MPSDSAALAVVTSGFGVGIIAGIVSGVCYVIFQGFSGGKRSARPASKLVHQRRALRHREAASDETVSREEEVCSRCSTCRERHSFFRESKPPLRHRNASFAMKMPENCDSTFECDRKVKDFIEKLVEAMVGYNLDDAPVTDLYDDPRYLPIIGQSPCSAHASLKLLLGRIVQEAIGLPKLTKVKDVPTSKDDRQIDRTYEDLLSTAILNKMCPQTLPAFYLENFKVEKRLV